MTFPAAYPHDDTLFRRCCAASMVLHAALMVLAGAGFNGVTSPSRTVMEIDLSIPYGSGGRKAGPIVEEPPKPLAPVEAPITQKPPKSKPVAVPNIVPVQTVTNPQPEPVLPPVPVEKPPQKAVLAAEAQPAPLSVPEEAVETPGALAPGGPDGSRTGTGSAPLSGGGRGYGEGVGDGTGTGQPILPPRLLNKEEVLKNMKLFYPRSEWNRDREGQVVLKLKVDQAGQVEPLEIIKSAGLEFDEAAKKVARTMRFSAAMRRGRPETVHANYPFHFKLK